MKVELKKQKVFKDSFLSTEQTIHKTLHLATENILEIWSVNLQQYTIHIYNNNKMPEIKASY